LPTGVDEATTLQEEAPMKRFAVLTCTALAALALPALAGAKEISKVEICGEEGCNTISGWANTKSLMGHGESMSATASPPGPYYRVTLSAKHEEGTETWSIYYVPSGNRLALPDGQWEQLTGSTAAAYEDATSGLPPYPAPTLERVLIDGRAVEDPGSYLALFRVGSTGRALPSHLADWVPVDMRFRGETPWSGDPYVFFSASDGLIQRGIEIVRIPDEMAANIRAGESLASDSFPWALAAVIALAVALAAGGTLWLGLRRAPAPGARRAPIPT
jgi:hypothetical protein